MRAAGQRDRRCRRPRTGRRAPRARRRAATAHAPGAGARHSARPIRRRRARACRPRRSARPGARARAPASSPARARVGQRRSARLPGLPAARRARAVSTPACASSSARTAAGRVRLCQACWPWMSTSCSPASRSWRDGGRAAVDPGAALALGVDACGAAAACRRRVEAGLVQPGRSAGGASNSAVISARARLRAPRRRRRGRRARAAARRSGSTCRRRSRRSAPRSRRRARPRARSTMTKSRRARRLQHVGRQTTPSCQCSLRRRVA